MKGLSNIPTQKDFQQAYNQLLRGEVTEEKLALWSQWCRLDPRLAEILVNYCSEKWKLISPVQLNGELLKLPWPAALGVLLSYVKKMVLRSDISLFEAWANLVMTNIKPASSELFFIGTRALGGKLMFEDALFSHKNYLKWGFLGRQPLYNKTRFSTHTEVPAAARKIALKNLMKKRRPFTVSDYIQALNGQVSRRQAELDLKNNKSLRAIGNTKGKVYF